MTRHPYIVFVLLLCSIVGPKTATAASSVFGKVVFVEAADAPNRVARERLVATLSQLASQWHVPTEQIPEIVVFHVSEETGKALGYKDVAVHQNRTMDGLAYYEIWLIGEATLPKYAVGLQNIIEAQLALNVSEADRTRVLAKVIKAMQGTTSAYGK